MAKLNIGLVLDDSLDKPNGVQQYVLILGEWLAAQGHTVHYLVGQTARTDRPHIYSLSRNVSVRFNGNRMTMPLPARLRDIRAALARESFDVLHIQVPYSPLLGGRIIRAAADRTAIVGMFHILPNNAFVGTANKALSRWARMQGSLQRVDVMLANSEPTQAFAKQAFGVDSTIIPLPVALDAFRGAKPFPRYASGKTVVFLGRLSPRKGCQYLLQAVQAAVTSGQWPADARVVVCGDGDLRAKLEAYVQQHGLVEYVEFAGFIDEADKPRYLASADVAVFPSTGGESFGLVLLEAMAACPGAVIAGDNPGYASVMQPHLEQLFDPRDTTAFVRLLVHALARSRGPAYHWQRDYIKQFDVDVVGAQTVAVYQQALHKRRG
jgi:phosphatidyl-myo-inositol alpha-mannosyltransferase